MKKLIIYTTMGVVVIASGVFITNRVSAQELDPTNDTFISRVAEKLGIAQDEVVEVVEDLREEMHAERVAERAQAITQAMDEGKLTDRQAEILNAMEDLDIYGRPDDWDEWHAYSPEEREQYRETRRETRENGVIEALNEAGLEVSQDEMDALHKIMLEEGIGMYGKRGEKGLQMGSGMRGRGIGSGNGECKN
jgi:protein-disulfide isomerase-like protein with CxxC motif